MADGLSGGSLSRAALLLPQRQAQRRQHHQRQSRAQQRRDRIAPPPLAHARPAAARADAERTVFAPASQVLGQFLDAGVAVLRPRGHGRERDRRQIAGQLAPQRGRIARAALVGDGLHAVVDQPVHRHRFADRHCDQIAQAMQRQRPLRAQQSVGQHA
ncbi:MULTISPECIES: hypothetical protein [unclassified Lysobacter]|uniref:hypothetical protein n=1 Tax=unclassified Lysobacter TaxID=2635362 RepID=UPI001BE7DE8E|nr:MULTISPECIES: hypothetical protein [unclassified Lysobacter]MBT2749309.1 hypothetical protein [Lysobacter sp. ISL-42]MBT2753107.1 hypothetical protein [Lysobacter sp. ISL-50]MBT2777276.1 hypothetical protein [Lysobacter sp. ISL-54]MBT2783256.1 hypothetical protein [Lysobacter sp. ISL-52]